MKARLISARLGDMDDAENKYGGREAGSGLSGDDEAADVGGVAVGDAGDGVEVAVVRAHRLVEAVAEGNLQADGVAGVNGGDASK